MNAAQAVAFEEGTGSAFTAADLLLTIQGVGASAAFTFVAWLCVTAYRDYGEGDIDSTSLTIIAIRAVLILMVILAIFIN